MYCASDNEHRFRRESRKRIWSDSIYEPDLTADVTAGVGAGDEIAVGVIRAAGAQVESGRIDTFLDTPFGRQRRAYRDQTARYAEVAQEFNRATREAK